MNTRHSDLIAIANADLADKLTRGKTKTGLLKNNKKVDTNSANVSFIDDGADATASKSSDDHVRSFQHDVWKAVYTLNVFRYALGLALLIFVTASAVDSDWQIFRNVQHPKLFFFASLLLLGSAILFSYISKNRELEFNVLITAQFSLDVILAGILTHSTGSVDSNFVILYMIVVATGSVVLPRKHALALASGAIIVLFSEHIFSVITDHVSIKPHYSLLGIYGVVLLASSLLIAYLAERIRLAELKNYVPGNESIEEFLVREETNALKSALESTGGNKTEAAKLLGMSFRSFRYKLTKYDIQ